MAKRLRGVSARGCLRMVTSLLPLFVVILFGVCSLPISSGLSHAPGVDGFWAERVKLNSKKVTWALGCGFAFLFAFYLRGSAPDFIVFRLPLFFAMPPA